MTKAEIWAAKAGHGRNRYFLTNFAERSIYGEEIPLLEELVLANMRSSCLYSVHVDGGLKTGYREAVLFTLTECSRAKSCVSFAVTDKGVVERAVHKRGKCPFRVYF